MKYVLKCKAVICMAFIAFTLLACDFTPEPLPKSLVSSYELAIPIADTVLGFESLAFPNNPLGTNDENYEFLAGDRFSHSIDFPFYISEMTDKGREIEWIEPKAIIKDTKWDKMDVLISFYIESDFGQNHILLLNKKLIPGNNVLMGNVESRINPAIFASLESAHKIHITMTVVVNEKVKLKDILKSSAHIKCGLKANVKMGFSVN